MDLSLVRRVDGVQYRRQVRSARVEHLFDDCRAFLLQRHQDDAPVPRIPRTHNEPGAFQPVHQVRRRAVREVEAVAELSNREIPVSIQYPQRIELWWRDAVPLEQLPTPPANHTRNLAQQLLDVHHVFWPRLSHIHTSDRPLIGKYFTIRGQRESTTRKTPTQRQGSPRSDGQFSEANKLDNRLRAPFHVELLHDIRDAFKSVINTCVTPSSEPRITNFNVPLAVKLDSVNKLTYCYLLSHFVIFIQVLEDIQRLPNFV